MAESNAALSTRLASAGAQIVPSGFRQNVGQWYQANRKQILALVAGDEARAALFIAGAFAQVNKIPELLNCKPETFYSCLIFSMGTNLLPGPMAECYYLPFGNEAVFVPSYQGLAKLAFNSGMVTKIVGHVVWEKDEFDYNPATDDIHHVLFNGPESERGDRLYAYSRIKNTFGEYQTQVMTAQQIETIKSRSRGAKSSFSPWNSKYADDVSAMWIKTPFRRNVKWIAKSATPQAMRLAKAVDLDYQADSDEAAPPSILVDELDSVKELIGAKETKQIENQEVQK